MDGRAIRWEHVLFDGRVVVVIWKEATPWLLLFPPLKKSMLDDKEALSAAYLNKTLYKRAP